MGLTRNDGVINFLQVLFRQHNRIKIVITLVFKIYGI
jgi:hypothetical protein